MAPNEVFVVHREGSSAGCYFSLPFLQVLVSPERLHYSRSYTLTGVGSNSVYCWFELEETKKIK